MLQHTKLKIVMFLAIFGASSTAQALAPEHWNSLDCTIQKLRKITDELPDITSKKPYSVLMDDLKEVLDTLKCLSNIKPCSKHTVVDNAFKEMVTDLYQSLEKSYKILVNPMFKNATAIIGELKLRQCESFGTVVQRMEEHLAKIITLAGRCQPALVKDLTSFQTTTLIPLKDKLLPKKLTDYYTGLAHHLRCK